MAGFSRHYCSDCEQDSLHKGMNCVHCGTRASGVDMTPLRESIRFSLGNLFRGTPEERRRARHQDIKPFPASRQYGC